MRFQVEPRDVPAAAAARRMGLDADEFAAALPELLRRGFPPPDETTGRFDLDAIDAWRKLRHPRLFALTATPAAVDARTVVGDRLRRMAAGG